MPRVYWYRPNNRVPELSQNLIVSRINPYIWLFYLPVIAMIIDHIAPHAGQPRMDKKLPDEVSKNI